MALCRPADVIERSERAGAAGGIDNAIGGFLLPAVMEAGAGSGRCCRRLLIKEATQLGRSCLASNIKLSGRLLVDWSETFTLAVDSLVDFFLEL